ncbi:NfeD family protein [Glaciimonas sp. GG7]
MLKIILGMCIGLTLILSVGNAAPISPIAPVIVIPLTGAIGPASADFVDRNILRAQQQGAQLIVLRIDTPGGLDLSMRQIIQTILASKIPVASFVAPGGARAASAGTYILYASHIAAMAPGTNLGAASPVQIGMPEQAPAPPPPVGKDKAASTPGLAADSQSTLRRKQMHDAAAYIRGLAQMRGRNAVWAERAVREAVSLSADEALAQKVIDLTAQDVPELLRKLDGRQLNTADGAHVLHTASAPMMVIQLDERTRFLAIITDPSTALILLLIGVYGLIFEFANPGLVLPGVTGAICLLLGLFALQMLPVNYAGLALIFLGIGFLVAEMYLPTFGVVGIGGIVAFGIGAMMLIDTDLPGYGIPVSLIVSLAMMTALFVFFVSGAVLQSRRRPVVSGSEELLDSAGVMLGDTDHDGAVYQGWARVHSEHWRVNSTGPLHNGQKIRVIGRTGLVLMVQPVAMSKTGDE